MLQVIPNYTKVKTVLDNIAGMTTAFSIRGTLVQYEITYFLNGEAKTTWMAEQEFTVDATEKQTIGFKTLEK